MASKVKLELNDLREWMDGRVIEYASDTRDGKKLTMWIRLSDQAAIIRLGNNVIFQGTDLKHAIEQFNEI